MLFSLVHVTVLPPLVRPRGGAASRGEFVFRAGARQPFIGAFGFLRLLRCISRPSNPAGFLRLFFDAAPEFGRFRRGGRGGDHAYGQNGHETEPRNPNTSHLDAPFSSLLNSSPALSSPPSGRIRPVAPVCLCAVPQPAALQSRIWRDAPHRGRVQHRQIMRILAIAPAASLPAEHSAKVSPSNDLRDRSNLHSFVEPPSTDPSRETPSPLRHGLLGPMQCLTSCPRESTTGLDVKSSV